MMIGAAVDTILTIVALRFQIVIILLHLHHQYLHRQYLHRQFLRRQFLHRQFLHHQYLHRQFLRRHLLHLLRRLLHRVKAIVVGLVLDLFLRPKGDLVMDVLDVVLKMPDLG